MIRKLFIYSLLLALISCSNEKLCDENLQKSFTTKAEIVDGKKMEIIIPSEGLQNFINNYIVFENNKYRVTANKSEALAMGIESSAYDEICKEIINCNKMLADIIEECSKRSDIKSVKIINCNNINYHTENISTTKSTDMPSGVINTSGQETRSMDFVAPTEMKSIYAHCFSYVALLAGHTVLVEVSGEVKIGTRLGNGYVTVELPMSNVSGIVSFRTTDSNGGRCSWRGI